MKAAPAFALSAAALAAAAAFWFARNFVLFAYYGETVAVLDGGWYAGVLHGSDWKLSNPPVISETRDSYFGTHVTPFLIPFTYLAKALPLSAGEYMAAFLGLALAAYAALICIAAADFLSAQNPPLKAPLAAVLAAPVAFVLSMNGVSAEILHYPHFEIWIPIFVCAFLLALAMNKRKSAAAAFILLVAAREDGGFHLATALLAIAFFRQFPPRKTIAAQRDAILAEKEILSWSAAAFFVSLVAINSGGMRAPRPTVLDEQMFSHLASILTRGDWAPAMIVTAAWAAYARRPSALIGFAALIPWVAFSIPQEHPLRAHMGSYYGFPVLTALFWPFIAHRFFPPDANSDKAFQPSQPSQTFKTSKPSKPSKPPPRKKHGKESRPSETRPLSLAAAAFALVFAASTLILRPRESVHYNEMRVPKVGMAQLFTLGAKPVPAETRASVRKLRDFFVARADELNIIAADGFASLHPHDVPASRLLYRGPLKLEQNDAGILIAHTTWLQLFAKSVFAARAAFNLRHAYKLRDGSDSLHGFFLFSKDPLCDGNGKCKDDLPLSPTRLGDSYYDLAGGQISRDSFYFPAPALAAPGVETQGGAIASASAGTVASLENLPLGAGQTGVITEYAHAIQNAPPPMVEVEWDNGRATSELPPLPSGGGAAARMIVELPARKNITARVKHNGGGTLLIFSISAGPVQSPQIKNEPQ